VLLKNENYEEHGADLASHLGNSYPLDSIKTSTFAGLTPIDQEHLAILNTVGGQFRGDLEELDDAGTYFDLGPRKVSAEGTYNYMCTRNNNFSNRSQKAVIVVSNAASSSVVVDTTAASRQFAMGELITEEDAFTEPQSLTVKTVQVDGALELLVEPETLNLADGKYLKIALDYTAKPLTKPKIFKMTSAGAWSELTSTIENGQVTAQVSTGGQYRVVLATNGAAVFGIIAVIAVLAGAGGYYYYKKKQSGHSVLSS